MGIGPFWRDLQYAVRILLSSKLIFFLMMLSLALSIGATTTVFSFANAVLFRPLPYRDATKLVLLWASKSATVTRGISGPDLADLREQSQAFEDIVPFVGSTGEPLSFGLERTRPVNGFRVGEEMFRLLGTQPYLGRAFRSNAQPDEERMVVLSYSFWKTEFGANPGVVGSQIILNGEPYTIVGVMPEDFFFPDQSVQVWVQILSSQIPAQRGNPMLHAIARLKPKLSFEQGQAEVDAIAKRLAATYPDTDRQLNIGLFRLADQVLGPYRLAFWSLLGGMLLLLLIACANVAHFLLARGVQRAPEISTRLAFGATPRAIFRQLLTESVLLSIAGGAGGVFLAYIGVYNIRRLGFTDIPRFGAARVNGSVLVFAVLISLGTGVLCGALPALRSSQLNLIESLKQSAASYGYGAQSHVRDLLMIGEIAFTFTLMVAGGLLINSFVRLARVDWGFDPNHVLLVDTLLPREYARSVPQTQDFSGQVVSKLKALRGVSSVGISSGSIIRNWSWKGADVIQEGRQEIRTRESMVGPGYFQTLAMPLLRGRAFLESDGAVAPRVTVIEKGLAEQLWPDQDPIGKHLFVLAPKKEIWDEYLGLQRAGKETEASRLLADANGFDKVPFEVVGLVGPALLFGVLPLDSDPSIYVDYRQRTYDNAMSLETFLVRTETDPSTFANPARDIINQAGSGKVTIKNIDTLEERVRQAIGGRGSNELLLVISSTTGALGVLLTALGIYGMLSYAVTSRTREIGIRMALGEKSHKILSMILGRNILVTVAGLLFGVLLSLAFTKLLASYLFGVEPNDLPTFGATTALFLGVALLASYFPARRATQVDPVAALRHE